MLATSLRVLSVAVCIGLANADNRGIEQYNNFPGYFWMFNGAGVTVIDPKTNLVKAKIGGGSTEWGDTVYLRDQAQVKHYVLANDVTNGLVNVYNANTNNVISTIALGSGAKPSNLVSVLGRDEVWSHDDTSATFNVFRASSINIRARKTKIAAAGRPTKAGFGKLLANSNFQDTGLATNEKFPVVYSIDFSVGKVTEEWELISSTITQNKNCSGTRGIEYSPVSNRVYVQCVNPAFCNNATTASAIGKYCTGSIWGLDADTGVVRSRLVSSKLSNLNGANFGVQGEPIHSPDYHYMFVSNNKENTLHIVKHSSTGADIVMDVTGSNIVNPNQVRFIAKDPSLPYGSDATNYYVVVPVRTGVRFLDMSDVVTAFIKGIDVSNSQFSGIDFDTDGTTPPVEVGSTFIMAPTYKSGVSTGYVLINLDGTATTVTSTAVKGATEILWVPIPNDEVINEVNAVRSEVIQFTTDINSNFYQVNQSIAELSSSLNSVFDSFATDDDGDGDSRNKKMNKRIRISRDIAISGIVVGGVGFLIAIAALSMAMMSSSQKGGGTMTHV